MEPRLIGDTTAERVRRSTPRIGRQLQRDARRQGHRFAFVLGAQRIGRDSTLKLLVASPARYRMGSHPHSDTTAAA